LNELRTLLQIGRLPELESQAAQLTNRYPRSGRAWKALGVALHLQGKDAIACLQRAAALMPETAEAHANLALALLAANRYDEAIASLRRALQLRPDDAGSHNNLGNALRSSGRLEEALVSYRRAVELRPEDADMQGNLGNAYHGLHRAAEAVTCYRQALERTPDHAVRHAALGSALLDLVRPAEAAVSLQRALALDPMLIRAHGNLALASLALGRPEEALASSERALQLDPKLVEAHSTRGIALLDVGRVEDATAAFERALALRPDFPDALSNLAIALRLQGRADDALDCARRVLEIKPDSAAILIVMAEVHADKGEFPEAEQRLRQAMALEPENAEAWASFAHLRKMTADDAPWLATARRIAAGSLTPRKEAMLRYALGKCLDDLKRYGEAFEQYQRANEMARAHRRPYDRARQQRLTDWRKDTFGPGWMQRMRAHGVTSRKPVFIVGMPRSGTSLVEQILASHPAVFGAGELTFWQAGAARFEGIRRQHAPESPAECALIGELALQYLQQLDGQAPGALRVIDKMPDNFRHLGLIHAALPEARVIHMRRHPIDTCLSIYFQDLKVTLDYAGDRGDLAHFYGEYARLMQHWREVLPPELMLEVSYEELIQDQERWTRTLLEFLELPWEPRCLQFQQTRRSVLTASKWQVRQKITTSSAGRWRNYEPYLGELRALFGISGAVGAQ
jgi:tetratricopeptide (TPR) repeat protein